MTPAVLILAGSRPGARDSVAESEGIPHKVLALVEGQTLLERVIAAARTFGAPDIAVSANHPAVEAEALRLEATLLPAAKGPSEGARSLRRSSATERATLRCPLRVVVPDEDPRMRVNRCQGKLPSAGHPVLV